MVGFPVDFEPHGVLLQWFGPNDDPPASDQTQSYVSKVVVTGVAQATGCAPELQSPQSAALRKSVECPNCKEEVSRRSVPTVP